MSTSPRHLEEWVSPSVTVLRPGDSSDLLALLSCGAHLFRCQDTGWSSTLLLLSSPHTTFLCLFQAGTSASMLKMIWGLPYRPFQSIIIWMVRTLFFAAVVMNNLNLFSTSQILSLSSSSLLSPNWIRYSSHPLFTLDLFNRKKSRSYTKRLVICSFFLNSLQLNHFSFKVWGTNCTIF